MKLSAIRAFLANKWVKFWTVLVLYLLWAYWVGSWWLLILVPVIFDAYITKRVHWAFWKKKGVEKQTKTVEWIDALIFAVVAATLIRNAGGRLFVCQQVVLWAEVAEYAFVGAFYASYAAFHFAYEGLFGSCEVAV